ncbi:MAG: hypothetical protein KGL39_30580 [Patescibacteria group bacterium]|nr:hypothetical protein [Patescibacteria group bacterium]
MAYEVNISDVLVDPAFNQAWSWTLLEESGNPLKPSAPLDTAVGTDNNGYHVRFGFNAQDYPDDELYGLPMPQALDRAKVLAAGIWRDSRVGMLNDAQLAAKVFDYSFNAGTAWGVLVLQRALNALGAGLEEDGTIGPKTAAAANAYPVGDSSLMAAFVNQGKLHYERIVNAVPEDAKYLSGWNARLERHAV